MTESSKAVFLSYASQDAEAAARICEALTAANVEVWFDQSSLRGGDAWDALIRRQVRECAVSMPVISANTDTRTEGYFRLEWRLAVDRSHLMSDDRLFLLPVVIDDTPEPTARVPDRFRERQWSKLPAGECSPAFVEWVVGEHDLDAPDSAGTGRARSRKRGRVRRRTFAPDRRVRHRCRLPDRGNPRLARR